jgi:hypothetical protein
MTVSIVREPFRVAAARHLMKITGKTAKITGTNRPLFATVVRLWHPSPEAAGRGISTFNCGLIAMTTGQFCWRWKKALDLLERSMTYCFQRH